MARVAGRTPAKASEKVLLAQIGVEHTKARSLVVLAGGGAGALMILAMYPLARTFAGKETVLNASIALTFSLAMSLAGTAAGAYGLKQKRRADRAEAQLRDRSRDVKELQQRLRDNNVSDAVTR